MNESELQRAYNFPIYPRDFKKYLDKDSLVLIMENEMALIGLVL